MASDGLDFFHCGLCGRDTSAAGRTVTIGGRTEVRCPECPDDPPQRSLFDDDRQR